MEAPNARRPAEAGMTSLRLEVLTCSLCDMSFINPAQERAHIVVSGYDPVTGRYWPEGKYRNTHPLEVREEIAIAAQKLETEDIDSLVQFIIPEVSRILPFCKLDPDMPYKIRQILISFYTKKGETF